MRNNPVILFRKDFDNTDEYVSCQQRLETHEYRSSIPANSLVIGRYSVLPYYKELEQDLLHNNSRLINNYEQHKYIANFDYYFDIEEFTPKTYFRLEDVPEKGSFVVKGRTNSRKFDWNTKMFAQTRADAIKIATELYSDSLLEKQGIIVREYIPLKTFEIGINGLPFTNEWRLFFLGKELLAFDYYWSILDNIKNIKSDVNLIHLANKVANIVSKKTNFFVIDVAQKETGEWIVIEINDGQMSGLSLINPDILYENLRSAIKCHTYIS